MDFMVPAEIWQDLADGTLCLPDEIRINLAGRRPPYGTKVHMISANGQHIVVPVGELLETIVFERFRVYHGTVSPV